ncbi:MAG: MFS transporter [Spirochaetales bacterium]|nr:MFS transporter [Spirochaetales bacterium]
MKNPTRNITLLGGFHQGFHWFSSGLLIPVITLLQLEKGLTLLQVGLNMAVYSGVVLILELPTGGLADTIGRKRVYLLSRVFQIIAGVFFLAAGSFPLVLAGFAALGVSRALSSGSMDAYFIDALESAGTGQDLQRPLALMGMFVPLGLAAGSLLGGWLPMSLGPMMVRYGVGDIYSANVATALLFTILQLLFTVLVIHEAPRPGTEEPTKGINRFKTIFLTGIAEGFRNRRVFLLLLTTLAWGLAIAGLEQLWQPRVKSFLTEDSGTMIFGLLSTGYFAASALGSLMSIPLSRLLGNRHGRTMVLLRLIMGGLFILLSRTAAIGSFTVFYLLTFLANGSAESPHAALFNRNISANRRATMLSLDSLFLMAGGAVGSLYAGFVAERISIGASWLIGALILMVSSALYIPLALEKKTEEVSE